MRFSLGFYNRIIFLFLISAIIFFAKNNIARAEFNDNLESYSIGQSADVIFDDFPLTGDSVNWLITTGGTGTGTKKLFSDPNTTNDADIFIIDGDYNISNVYCFDIKLSGFTVLANGGYYNFRLSDGGVNVVTNLFFQYATENPGFIKVKEVGTQETVFYLAQNYWHNICLVVNTETDKVNVCTDIYNTECHDNEFPFEDNPIDIDSIVISHYTQTSGANSDVSIDNFTTSEIPFDWVYDAEIIIEELPEWDGNIQVGSEFILSYNPYNFCFIGEECLLKYNYGYDAIGGELSLLFEEEIIASTTLQDIRLLQGSFTLEDEPAGTEKEYCFLIETDDVRELYCDVSVEWIDRSWCKEELVCEDVATSSDFLYGVQCGFRRTICWMFNPTDNSIKYLSKNIQNFEHSFPFSLAFDFINVAEETIENSTSTGAVFGIPMVSTSTIGTSSEDQFYLLPVMDENTIRDILSVKTVDTVTENVMYLVWAVTAGLIIFIVIKFGIL